MFDMRDPFKLLTLIKNNYGILKNKIFQKKWGKKATDEMRYCSELTTDVKAFYLH